MATAPIMIVTPIWRPALRDTEAAFLRVTDRTNRSTPRTFVAPTGMSTDWYRSAFPDWDVRFVDARHLSSVAAYSSWMTSAEPYRMFSDVSLMVLCQTDAVLIRSVLDLNTGSFDFLGAPWSPPLRAFQLGHKMAVYSPTNGGPWRARLFGRRLRVGNGGLSLRGTAAFNVVATELHSRFPDFFRTRIHEDVYFAALGPRVGLRIADPGTAGSVFCEAEAEHLSSPGNLWGFHGLERWNPTLARRVIESFDAGSAT